MTKNLFCMGNPLLDISAICDETTLTKYDLKAGNAILAEEKHMPLYDELAAKPDVVYIPGGATLNSARVAAWVANKDTQWVTYTGAVSKDKYGDILVQKAEAEKLAMPVFLAKDVPTGTCAVVIVDKERSLVANLSAATKFEQAHLQDAKVKAAIEAAQLFYVSGFFLTSCAPAFVELAKHANDNQKTFTMNLSAPFIVDFFTDALDSVVEYADILFGNETEARALSAKKGWETDDVKVIAAKAQQLPKTGAPRTVVFTQGADATVVATPDSVTAYAVPKVENIVDTNGAGDAFVGGFLAKYAEGADLETAVQTGHKAAARIIASSGCTWDSAF